MVDVTVYQNIANPKNLTQKRVSVPLACLWNLLRVQPFFLTTLYICMVTTSYAILIKLLYRQTPEIKTADISQSPTCLNLSQFQVDCLLRITSSTTILNHFKLFESILGIVTALINEKYWYFTLLKTLLNWYVMHSLFLSMMNVSHGNLRIFIINFEY